MSGNCNSINILKGQKFIWRQKCVDISQISSLALQTNLSIPIVQVLLSRNLDSKEKILDFLFPQISLSPKDYLLMEGASLALNRINEALEKKHKILIFGDYDVDGMTSTSIAMLALKNLGATVNYYLPNREKDGYGLSVKIVRRAAVSGYQLIITVDNGTTCLEAAQEAISLGIDLIITDHHQPKGELPNVLALVNPHQISCRYPYKHFCGAGVIFKLMSFLYQQKNKVLPDKIYELLLLGTVADVVPLTGENRYWVNHGLNLLNQKIQSFSFKCLANNAKKTDKTRWTSQDIGFGLAPQLNALGRLDDPLRAVRFLIGSNQEDVLRIAQELYDINLRRREIEGKIYQELETRVIKEEIDLKKERVIFAASQNWPMGVIGLAAGKLTNNFGRPSFIFHITETGLAKGSCRSIPDYNLFEALGRVPTGLLKTFGGHRQAAGLSLDAVNLKELKLFLEDDLASRLSFEELQPSLSIDADLKLSDMNKRFLDDWNRLEPFGNENMSPLFLLKNLVLLKAPELIKDKHLKVQIFSDGVCKSVIFFNRADLLQFFIALQDEPFDLVAQMLVNEFNGTTKLELQGLDVKKSSKS